MHIVLFQRLKCSNLKLNYFSFLYCAAVQGRRMVFYTMPTSVTPSTLRHVQNGGKLPTFNLIFLSIDKIVTWRFMLCLLKIPSSILYYSTSLLHSFCLSSCIFMHFLHFTVIGYSHIWRGRNMSETYDSIYPMIESAWLKSMSMKWAKISTLREIFVTSK